MELADMVFRIDGPLSDALDVIDHDPLGYARRVGIDPATDRAARWTSRSAWPFRCSRTWRWMTLTSRSAPMRPASGVPAVVLGQDLSDGDCQR